MLRPLGAGEPMVPVWRNTLGGLTWQIGTGPGRRFVKWAPAGSGLDLAAEVVRLRWAGAFTTVPHVLAHGSDASGAWTVTAGLTGDNAVSDRWRARPGTAVRAAGRGLRAFHERLPVDACPWSWSVEDRIAEAGADPERVDRSGVGRLGDPPPVDRLVVCHGDACVPNTLLDDDGAPIGHVDLGSLGTADRWADIAVATWSTEWNYGPGWEAAFLDAYGVAADPVRTAFYRDLWALDADDPDER